MLYSIAEVALYLNLATIRLNKEGGSLSYLTDDDKTKVELNQNDQSEETQCLSFGSALWIANNADADSETQYNLLKTLGIGTRAELLHHVETYGIRVLPYVRNAYQLKTEKQTLLHNLLTRHGEIERAGLEYGGGGAPVTFRLASEGVPAGSGITFVTGRYDSKGGGDSDHAEQKLLAVLATYLKNNPRAAGNVSIKGCKGACSVCEKVLIAAQEAIKEAGIPVVLRYDDAILTEYRNDAGLAQKKTDKANQLNFDHYFK